jgi:uncharacterized membrane protein
MMAFLYLIDYTARLLRPVAIVWRIGEQGIKVIESVYPNAIREPEAQTKADKRQDHQPRVVNQQGKSSIILAVNLEALVALARRTDGVVELVPRVGDFVAAEEPMFRLYGGAAKIDDHILRQKVAMGPERTIEQDSTFAFRVVVDIAIKALSKAINDPTTAVLAIDQLHRLLRRVGNRQLQDDRLLDADGKPRVIFPTPDWDDFVELTFREIRLYGAENPQIARRLRAMLVNLISTLTESRRPALQRELDLLDRTLERLDLLPEDLELAR